MHKHFYTQQKYCSKCGSYFQYVSYDVINITKICPAGHPNIYHRGFMILKEQEVRSRFYALDNDQTFDNYKVLKVTTNATDTFSFVIPTDVMKIHAIRLLAISQSGGSGKDIDLYSSYGKVGVGEQYNQYSESDTSSTYDLGSAGELVCIDITHLFPDIDACMACGIKITHNSIGGDMYYLGVGIEYRQQES